METREYQHITAWQAEHDRKDDVRFSQMATKEEMEEIVEKVLKKVLFGTSKWTYRAIIVIAIIVGSLVTIGGGFKIFLGWLGYSKI